MNDICFLIPIYGKIPVYFQLFAKSAYNNQNYSFLFFSDLNLPIEKDLNIKLISMDFIKYKSLIELKTGVKPIFNDYYKMVDFKPAYGLIFEDYITNFQFWGILDVDLILGKINDFINYELLLNNDIISVRKSWVSGSFTLFRNCNSVNNLFKKSLDWEKVFSTDRLFRFTECGTIKNSNASPINQIKKGIKFSEIETDIESFMRVITNESKLNGIKVHFNDLVNEGLKKGEIMCYKDGNLFLTHKSPSIFDKSQRFLHYHFVTDKNKVTFNYPLWKEIPDEYYITNYGFILPEQMKYLVFIKTRSYLKALVKFIFVILPKKIKKKISQNTIIKFWGMQL